MATFLLAEFQRFQAEDRLAMLAAFRGDPEKVQRKLLDEAGADSGEVEGRKGDWTEGLAALAEKTGSPGMARKIRRHAAVERALKRRAVANG